jgi:AraC-like DNA-binding protein
MDRMGLPLLERQRVFHSRDIDLTAAFLDRVGFRLEPTGDRRDRLLHDARFNGVYMPSLFLGYVQYGSPASVWSAPTRQEYWLQLPVAGTFETRSGGDAISVDSNLAVLISPTRDTLMRTAAQSGRILVAIHGPALLQTLAALLGEQPRAPLEFEPAMALAGGYGRSLARMLRLAAEEFEEAGAGAWPLPVMSRFEQLVMTRLLLEHPHNYTEALGRRERRLVPRDVKRAIDYIHEHLAQPIQLADLVAASGVPGRTLFQHFRQFQGASPMRYIRDARLEKARAALAAAAPDHSVTEIAMRCGCFHLGRFAVEYRRRFGEKPSETLAKGPGERKAAGFTRPAGEIVSLVRKATPSLCRSLIGAAGPPPGRRAPGRGHEEMKAAAAGE